MQQTDHNHKIDTVLHVYLITDGTLLFAAGLKLAETLRNKVHGLKVLLHCGWRQP